MQNSEAPGAQRKSGRVPAKLLSAAVVLLCSCGPIPPYVYHEGLTAEMRHSWLPNGRAGANYLVWQHDSVNTREWNFLGGACVGQKLGRFGFEEGLVAYGFKSWQVGLTGAFGLRNPPIALRASYYPLSVTDYFGHGWHANLGFLNRWWQSSLLGGYRFSQDRFGLFGGGIASPRGWGPTLIADCRLCGFALRGQGSFTFRSPWAPSRVAGHIVNLGLTVAWEGTR
jgi:hypothetical protein